MHAGYAIQVLDLLEATNMLAYWHDNVKWKCERCDISEECPTGMLVKDIVQLLQKTNNRKRGTQSAERLETMVLEGFRDSELAKKISEKIQLYATDIDEDLIFMHVSCLTPMSGRCRITVSDLCFHKISNNEAGSGCPVCITPGTDIEMLLLNWL